MYDKQPPRIVAVRPAKPLLATCLFQAIAAAALAVGSSVRVETILGFGPLTAGAGFLVALAALRRRQLGLLLYGLSAPLVTAVLAMLIGAFHWSPREAAWPARILLGSYGVAVWYASTRMVRLPRAEPPKLPGDTTRGEWQFNIRTLLVLVTSVSLLLGVMRLLPGRGEMAMFLFYAGAVFAITCALAGVHLIRWIRARQVLTLHGVEQPGISSVEHKHELS